MAKENKSVSFAQQVVSDEGLAVAVQRDWSDQEFVEVG
jgi:hypothetical protein